MKCTKKKVGEFWLLVWVLAFFAGVLFVFFCLIDAVSEFQELLAIVSQRMGDRYLAN